MKIIVCKTCKEEKQHKAFGLCRLCYNRTRKKYMWEYNQKPEVKKRKKEWGKMYAPPIIICKTCKEEKEHEAFGLCVKCYQQTPKRKKQREEHYQRPEVKVRKKGYGKEYYQKNKVKRKEYHKGYGKEYYQKNKDELKKYKNGYIRYRRKNDEPYRILMGLRNRFSKVLKKYSKIGKIKPSCEYGIDYQAIIEHLKPFKEGHQIDHIIPLAWFDFNNAQEIKWAFSPENHQWLTKKENMWKSNSFIWIKEQ